MLEIPEFPSHPEIITLNLARHGPNFSVKWTFAVIIQVGFSYFILNRDQNLNLNPNLNLKFKKKNC